MKKSSHPNHEDKIKRLNRIAGQLKGIIKVIENKKYCVDILQQTRAITAAIKSVEQLILKDHMNACVSSAMQSKNKKEQDKKIEEVLKLINKF